MAETHAHIECEEKQEGGEEGGERERTDRGGEGQRLRERERRYESESVQNRTELKKGWRGQESCRETEEKEERPLQTEAVVEFRGQSPGVGVFSTLTEEQHHYSFFLWQAALTQLVK